jgi:hypothetical protein
MIRMVLCPNCRTIQKAGTNCSICKCPVEANQEVINLARSLKISEDQAYIIWRKCQKEVL